MRKEMEGLTEQAENDSKESKELPTSKQFTGIHLELFLENICSQVGKKYVYVTFCNSSSKISLQKRIFPIELYTEPFKESSHATQTDLTFSLVVSCQDHEVEN